MPGARAGGGEGDVGVNVSWETEFQLRKVKNLRDG